MEEVRQLQDEVRRLKTAVDELTVLNDLAVAASSSLETEQMLDTIVRKSIKAVKAEQGSISLVTAKNDQPLKTLIRHMDQSDQQLAYKVGIHITGWVLKNKKPLIIENLATDDRFKTSDEEKKTIRSALCVPIFCRAELLGILMMLNKKTGGPFEQDDLRLLSIIAAQSGQLIRNSQLQQETIEKKRMEQELAVARRIQMSLLPSQQPTDLAVDMATYFNPAKEVGGDYFDIFRLGDDRIGIVIADVSGHGSPAAMMMTMVKGILHSITYSFDSADKTLTELNSILTRISPKDIFITMIFLELDLRKKILRFSNAGHNPMLYYDHARSSYEMLKLPGMALNLSRNSEFLMKEMPMKHNDFLLIYTDGVTEAVNTKMEMFEDKRLLEAVKDVTDQPVHSIITHIKSCLDGFTGEMVQADDILMFGIKFK